MTGVGVEPDAYFIEEFVAVTLGVQVDEVGVVGEASDKHLDPMPQNDVASMNV